MEYIIIDIPMVYIRGGEMICMENQSVNIFRDKDGQNVVLI